MTNKSNHRRECFDFYGLPIEVSSSSADLVEQVRRDFAYFRVPPEGTRPQVFIQMHLSSPPYGQLPPLKASFFTPRNVCFQKNNITYIDYFGKGLAIFDRNKKECIVYGTDQDLAREIVYLFILSTVGRYFDSRRIHRIHALGVSYKQHGILLLLPSGGGKSTMALELLQHPDFFLLGEDTPLIDRQGTILPFPLRIGVQPGKDTEIPLQYLRTVRRMEFDPKTLIDLEYFHDRIGQTVAPSFVLVGERNLGEVSKIAPLSKYSAFNAMAKYMIVGLGVYQGLEFLLERGTWEIFTKVNVVGSRTYNSLRLLSRSQTYRFVMGRDLAKNCKTFLAFISEKCK